MTLDHTIGRLIDSFLIFCGAGERLVLTVTAEPQGQIRRRPSLNPALQRRHMRVHPLLRQQKHIGHAVVQGLACGQIAAASGCFHRMAERAEAHGPDRARGRFQGVRYFRRSQTVGRLHGFGNGIYLALQPILELAD